MINGKTTLVGVLGHPVGHSLSPEMHNAAFAKLALNWCYVPLPVAPENLAEALRGARALGFRGLNLTVPHKVTAIPLLDWCDPSVHLVGAVNTIRFTAEGRAEGFNTDMDGFLADLAANGITIEAGARVLVLGAGGAARAVAAGIVSKGGAVIFANRSRPNADQLAAILRSNWPNAQASSIDLETGLAEAAEGVHLVVNTTPLGMYPHTEASPWPADLPFPKAAQLYDTIYRPQQTRFMQQVEAVYRPQQGRAINGLGMLIEQGAAAFRLWTGQQPDLTVMREACLQKLRS
jgi:shikimate dehydrogenase